MGKKKRERGFGDRNENLLQALARESDRAIVLIAMEFISDGLESCLRERFSSEEANRKLQDRLLTDINAPLNTPSTRIDVCRAIGLVDERTHQALQSLRALRNRAAHQTHFSATDPGNSSDVILLQEYAEDMRPKPFDFRDMWVIVGENYDDASSARRTLLDASAVIHLHIYADQSQQGDEPSAGR